MQKGEDGKNYQKNEQENFKKSTYLEICIRKVKK